MASKVNYSGRASLASLAFRTLKAFSLGGFLWLKFNQYPSLVLIRELGLLSQTFGQFELFFRLDLGAPTKR